MNDDLISRQEVIDALESSIVYFDYCDEIRGIVRTQQAIINTLPSASKSYILRKLEKQRQEREGE